MADKKISELVNLTSLATDDEFVVVDKGANATKRLTYDTLATEIRTEAEALSGTTAAFTGDVSIADKIVHTGDTNTAVRFPSADTVTVETAGSERMRITSGGASKASTTGTYFNAAANVHEWRVNANGLAGIISNINADPRGLYISFGGGTPDNNTAYFLVCDDATAARCYIWSDGDLANHDGVYGTISDEKLKQDIVDAGSQWDDIKAIRFRKYRMKSDVEADPDAPYLLGVVAQELVETSPGLVDEHPEVRTVQVPILDEEGNETGEFREEQQETGDVVKTVKSSILLMKAAKALQEAMDRIEVLEAKVSQLESA